jgi:hypothetical protein
MRTTLPPIPDEHVRLWRGLTGPHDPAQPAGEFWTSQRKLAEDYAEDPNIFDDIEDDDLPTPDQADPTLFYLDVPIELAFTWPDHDGRLGAQRLCGEHIVPLEWQSKAVALRLLEYVK